MGFYHAEIPIDKIQRDPLNPRNEQPTEELIESLKKVGYKSDLTVRENGNNTFLATDGWERVQGGIIANLKSVPCKVYDDSLEALEATRAVSINRNWTKLDYITHIHNYYVECRKKGMSHHKSLNKTVAKNDISQESVMRYIRIWKLPNSIKILLKEPKKRSRAEWKIITKDNSNIKKYKKILPITIADLLSINRFKVSEERLLEIATNVVGKKNYMAKKIICQAIKPYNSDKSIRDIIDMVRTNKTCSDVLNLPTCISLKNGQKNILLNYLSKRRIKLNDFVSKLIINKIQQIEGGD